MRIGILSDSHDKSEAMAAAVALLGRHGAEFYLHCGDIGQANMLDHLAGLKAAFVWGNTDYDRLNLDRYAQKLGIWCYGSFGDLSLDGKRIALIHGDDDRLRRRLLEDQQFDYLMQGHTHIRADQRIGRTRLINPGALHRANPKTVALLDTQTDGVEIIEVEVQPLPRI